jgi:heat shock protein HtpX
MFKTIGLWVIMNIAVIIVITIVFAILSHFFGISLDLYGQNYLSIWIYAAVIWFSGSFISLAMSKWMAKRAYKITLIDEKNESNLDDKERVVYNTVVSLAKQHWIKTPEVGIYEDSEPNAFATGPSKNKSLVAVSTWLLSNMSKDAIEWVVAHEMAHVLNGDMVTMTLLQWVLNTFVIFFARIVANIFNSYTDWKFGILWYFAVNILLQILFWILASLIAMKFSRYREYRADAWSAKFVGKQKMIAGLEALKQMQEKMHSKTDSKFAAMQISTRKKWWIMQLLSSHPDLDDRIKALEELRI